ncbi:hypothetical protein [Inquilinus sp. CAU 1745]|uniref:hypothetical protein n=1 Tax=Inquilinus sp. CAU 1745 TaxID=3140369 RepID=UPI00325B1B0B
MTEEAGLPLPIRDALQVARGHPAITLARVLSHSTSSTVLETHFETALPSRWRAAGESPTGVRTVEPVYLTFRSDYPARAPIICLRTDFNRSLPHINPHDEGDYVPPCVVFGGVTEFFHREGLGRLLDQTALWLRNAAHDELIDPTQGWEPVRRDEVIDRLVFDPAEIGALVTDRAGFAYLPVRFLTINTEGGSPGIMVGVQSASPVRIRPATIVARFDGSVSDGVLSGETLAVVCWAGKTPSGALHVSDQYLPETVTTYGRLLARADAYGCGKPFRDAVSWLRKSSAGATRRFTYPLVFILCARRPTDVIGTASPFEFLAYRCDASFPGLLASGDVTPVQPVAHCHPVTQPLLRRMSGLPVDLVTPSVTMVGCGSLGSKIAVHLARTGLPPRALLDRGSFRPHNAARHALHPGGITESALSPSKARALAKAIAGFGGTAPATHDGDVLLLRPGTEDFSNAFPADQSLIINTTASHAVRDHLGALGNALAGRVAEGALADDGRVGLLTLEGPQRNPDTTDLAAAAYEELRSDGRLAGLDGLSGHPTRVPVGIGCDSVTLVMSDTRVSMHAAAVPQRLVTWMEGGFPNEGALHLGVLGDDDLSLSWRYVGLGPSHMIAAENDSTWTIRVLDRAHQRILDDITRWPRVETGGVIVGRVSPVRRLIHVTDVIEAPPDSSRSAGAFVLGTSGLSETVNAYEATGAGALWCLGTWHSHLAEQGGSPRDYATAAGLEGHGRRAVLLLIRRPTGYSAIVKSGA